MPVRKLLLVVLLAAAWAWGQPGSADPGGSLELRTWLIDQSGSHFTRLQWDRQGPVYVSREGRRSLSEAEVLRLREALLQASPESQHLTQELGITPETVLAHREDIMRAAQLDGVPAEFESELGFTPITTLAFRHATGATSSTGGAGFELTIQGTPTVTACAGGLARAYMFPWTIKAAPNSTESYSTEVPLLVSSLMDPEDAGAGLLDGRDYWTEGFWNDSLAWKGIGTRVRGLEAAALARSFPGARELEERFSFRYTGRVRERTVSICLQANSPRLVEVVRWEAPLGGQYDWATLLCHHAAAEKAVGAHSWLLDWKGGAPERTLLLEEVDEEYLGAWKEARLSGRPDYQLTAIANQLCIGTLLLATGCNQALVVSAPFVFEGPPWLDNGVAYHPPSSNDFILIDEQGHPHRKRGR